MDEARIEWLTTRYREWRFTREWLTHQAFLDRALGKSVSPEVDEARRRFVEATGGPPTQEAMRAWLDSTFVARDSGAKRVLPHRRCMVGTPAKTLRILYTQADCAMPDGPRTGQHLRQQACPHCAAVTTQTLHGYTVSGRLWKMHACACQGWECRGCGAVLDPEGECCR
jgi:hypothetical protein